MYDFVISYYTHYYSHLTPHSYRDYSVRKDFTGFAIAAFIAW
jgi:hypothetical protein